MTILGIDTSCDDTSAACVSRGDTCVAPTILSNVVFTQLFHSKYGGVVPELASRGHIKNIVPIVNAAIKPVGIEKLDGIGVTYGPGLLSSLLVGVSFAKSMSYALGIPFYGVNHLEGHIFSLFTNRWPEFPIIILIASGGHTELIMVNEGLEYKGLGSTLDDAAGEAFDKGARLLGLPYPGGSEIQKLAYNGNPDAVNFPRAKVPGYDFSFSGLKTAVLYHLRDHRPQTIDHRQDIAASFQEAVIDSLIDKLVRAAQDFNVPRIGGVGGVAANSRLREKLKEIGDKDGLGVYFPSPELCTDNGVMIALCAEYWLGEGNTSPFSLKANPRVNLGTNLRGG